ncbi:MAG: ComEC/Rec2 family competence protein [Thermoflavifilum sp.]|nr:ComEC/Rec2 family competence protein [Thermoflavifilum sp.]
MMPSTARLLIALAAGILAEIYRLIPFTLAYLIFGVALGWSLFFAWARMPPKSSIRLMPLHGSMIWLMWMGVGYWVSALQDPRMDPHWIAYHFQPQDQWIGICRTAPEEKSAGYQFLVEVQDLLHGSGKIERCKGKILCYLRKTAGPLPCPGDTLFFRKAPRRIPHRTNPGMPDFASYLEHQHMYYEIFLDSGTWKLWKRRTGFSLQDQLNRLKIACKNKLYDFLPDPDVRGFAYALITGDRSALDQTLIQQYRNTGTIHILAISGLHIGMLFGVWMFVLGLFRVPAQMSSCIALMGIWAFVLFSGMAASACRAAWMITLLILPRWILKRPVSSLDALIGSAILLLIIHPAWIMDIGFQLSYLAVAGILLYYPFIYQHLSFKNKIIKTCWGMVAASLSAQLLILPLSLYTFHQFPFLFLLTNLIAIPLSSILLVLTCVLLVSPWPLLSSGIATGILLVGRVLHESIAWFNALSWNRITNLFISFSEMIWMFIFLICILAFFMKQSKMHLWIALAAMLCLGVNRNMLFLRSASQQKFIVYHLPHVSLLQWIEGHSTVCWLSEHSGRNISPINELSTSRVFFHIQRQKLIYDSTATTHLFTWHHLQFMLLDGRKHVHIRLPDFSFPYYLIVTHNAIPDSSLLKKIAPKAVVLDGTNAGYTIARWKNLCERLNLHLHSTSEQGAFVLNL